MWLQTIAVFSKILFPSLIFFLATSLALTMACDIPILPPQHLFHIPSWQTQKFTCSAPPEVYIIKPSPNRGLDVFAARTLQPGTPIMHGAPLVSILPPQIVEGVGYPLEAMMSSLRTSFFSLSEEDQSLYLLLHAHIFPTEALNTEEDYLMSVFRSNAFNTRTSFGLLPKSGANKPLIPT